ncbi:Zinc-binding protein (plasmid) [Pararobbsia alpina]|uniref:primase-helicase zinc-binding domain-containing protein n=1 Tax=Pararobbsia alpina TaxID=621374 RepID=UPI0039A543D4
MNLQLNRDQWISLLVEYGVREESLTGRAAPCPVCGGTDRFTFDNKCSRGGWVCRRCNNGSPKAGDGIALICAVKGIRPRSFEFVQLAHELTGRPVPETPHRQSDRQEARLPADDRVWKANRIEKIWSSSRPGRQGDLISQYLQRRVPGLDMPISTELRLGKLSYCDEQRKRIGVFPAIVGRYSLPDGRMATLQRHYLDSSDAKLATILTGDGEILPAKKNEVTALPLAGGAVRLMSPLDGEIGVAEGLENACASWMKFRVPCWYALNRVNLARFVVPSELGIKRVHIFADFDVVDPNTGKSPGMADALTLQKRLRDEGFEVVFHRPKKRGTDFADEWIEAWLGTQSAIERSRHMVAAV